MTASRTCPSLDNSAAGRTPVLFVVAAVLLFSLLPVLLVKHPAIIDFPNHLARHYIGSAIDSSPDLQRFYIYQWRPVANMAGDVLYIPLSAFLSPLDSERALIIIAIASWIIAPFVLNRVIWGRWSYGPALCGLIAFNASLRGGLENFLIASASAIFCFALWIAWQERMTATRLAIFAILASAVCFGHILAFVVLGLLIGPYEIQRQWGQPQPWPARLRRLALHALPFLPGVGFFLAFAITTRTTGEFVTSYGGVESRLSALFSLVIMYNLRADLLALLFFLGIVAWRFAINWRGAVHPSLKLLLLTLLIVTLLCPAEVQGIRAIHIRLPFVLASVLVAGIDWNIVNVTQWRMIGAALAIAFSMRTGSVTSHWLQHEAEVSELRNAFQKLERGAVVLPVVNPRADTGDFHWFTLSYAVLDRQIFTPLLYTDIHMLNFTPPFRNLTQFAAAPVSLSDLPSPDASMEPSTEGSEKYWRTWWNDFSYLLVLSRTPIEFPFGTHVQLITEGSFFRIYRILHIARP